MPRIESRRFQASERSGEVSALLQRPDDAMCLLVFAHGAGADMNHRNMVSLASALADRRIATLRYQFPYSEQGRRPPSPKPILTDTVRSAVAVAAEWAGDLPLLAGGRSMGGRMTSLAASQQPLPGVKGIVFFSFPLHPSGRPATERADHLDAVPLEMLFLQGTRDKLADLQLLKPLCQRLGSRARLYLVEGADHSFQVLKRSGRSGPEVLEELADSVEAWSSELLGKAS